MSIKLAHSNATRTPWVCTSQGGILGRPVPAVRMDAKMLPTKCECGSAFDLHQHALNCPNGAFPILRHIEVRDFTEKLLAEVCPDVTLEPDLQPLEEESLDFASANHEDNARADIRARGFWGGNCQCAFLMSRFLTQMRNPTDGHP